MPNTVDKVYVQQEIAAVLKRHWIEQLTLVEDLSQTFSRLFVESLKEMDRLADERTEGRTSTNAL